jgi:hypothetical protein
LIGQSSGRRADGARSEAKGKALLWTTAHFRPSNLHIGKKEAKKKAFYLPFDKIR